MRDGRTKDGSDNVVLGVLVWMFAPLALAGIAVYAAFAGFEKLARKVARVHALPEVRAGAGRRRARGRDRAAAVIWPWGALAYSLVAVFALRTLAGGFAYSLARSGSYYRGSAEHWRTHGAPTLGQWVGGGSLALCVAVIWPAVLVWQLAERVGPRVGAEREVLLERRERDLKAAERRLLEAERELGIGG